VAGIDGKRLGAMQYNNKLHTEPTLMWMVVNIVAKGKRSLCSSILLKLIKVTLMTM